MREREGNVWERKQIRNPYCALDTSWMFLGNGGYRSGTHEVQLWGFDGGAFAFRWLMKLPRESGIDFFKTLRSC